MLTALGARPSSQAEADLTAVALRGSLAHLAASDALLVLVDLEELWDEREPENRPGTGTGTENWRHRAALTVGELSTHRAVADLLRSIDAARNVVPA